MKNYSLFKGVFFVLISITVLFASISCTTGLGESIDLTAPELEITYPRHGSYVRRSVTVKGIAKDDRGLYGVEVFYRYMKDGEKIENSKMAQIEGAEWSCDFEFDDNYEVEFEAFAYDVRKNGSDTSHDRVMVLIDTQDPEAFKMSIRRGNYVARLLSLDKFTEPEEGRTALKNQPQNKDYFQNEQFTILSNLNDNYNIGSANLDLYEVDAETNAESLLIADIKPDSENNKFSPEFTITEEMLSMLSAGKVHYLKPVLKATDEAGNQSPNRVDGYLAWEPEYNTPHINFNSMDGGGSEGVITVTEGEYIPVVVFDDDELQSIEYGLVKESEFSTCENVPLKKVYENTENEKLRDQNFEVATKGNEAGIYYLVAKIIDKSTKNEAHREDGTYFKETKVKIINADAPVIIVENPQENSVPNLTDGKFTINGQVIDNQYVSKIAIAWLPNGNNDLGETETFFNEEYTFDADKVLESGIKVYNLSTAEDAITSPNYEGEKYSTGYTKTFNFFGDFVVNGNVDNSNKVFMIAARDKTDNLSLKTFRMSKFATKPKFIVEYKTPDDSAFKKTENPLITLMPKTGEFKFQITPQTENGLGLSTFTVKDSNIGLLHDNIAKYEFSETNSIVGKLINLTLYAKDVLGAESTAKLTILFDELGTLESITCNRNKGTIFTEGETIKLQANFTGKVNVFGNAKPYIQLGCTGFAPQAGEKDLRAVYAGGTGTNTLYFEYKVPEGIECNALTISEGNPITVPTGAEMEGVINVSLSTDKTINDTSKYNYSIDSIAPYIVTYSPAKDGVVEKKNDGSVDIKLTFNENVNVESGTIVVKRTANWYIPPVLSEEVFLKIWNAASNDDRETLCGSSSNVFIYKTNTTIATGPYMQYTNGIKIKTGGYTGSGNTKDNSNTKYLLPDTDTKYVLAYDYNIGDTSGTVSNLRTILEKHDYHKAEFEATLVSVSGKVVTLNVKDSDFIDCLRNGVEYMFTVTAGAFYDKAYNYSDGIKENEYKFWVGPVATPVIRVDRTATNATNDEPSVIGKAKVKIDCETPGATISYGYSTKTVDGGTTGNVNETIHTYVGDLDEYNYNSNFEKTVSQFGVVYTAGEDYENPAAGSNYMGQVGDGLGTTAQKIHIRAKAAKTGFVDSAYGLEGAFKTVLHYNYTNGRTLNRIYGCQSPEGNSFTASWPLAQNGEQRQNYQIPYNAGGGDFYWVSWQILTDFTLQTYAGAYQNPADPACSYGQYIYAKNKKTYSDY